MTTKTTGNKNTQKIDPERLKETGPFPKENRRVLIYSIGAGNEGHGDALPSNIDDYMGRRTALLVSERTGFTYRGHIPYASSSSGEIARDWHPGYIPMADLIANMTNDILSDIQNLKKQGTEASHVAVISGHGGNNTLKKEEANITHVLGIPFFYMPPFPDVVAESKEYGRVVITHADHGEHSIALYLGLLDKKKLENINRIARTDPLEALRQNPPIMGLGYYVLPQLGGDRYESVRSRHPELLDMAKQFVEKDRKVIADFDVGRQLFEGNVDLATENIKKFVRDTK